MADENNIPFKQLKKRMCWVCDQTLEALQQSGQLAEGFDQEIVETFKNLTSLVTERCEQFILLCEELEAVFKTAFFAVVMGRSHPT